MSYNSGSNRARNYSRDYSLNCTPLGPSTLLLIILVINSPDFVITRMITDRMAKRAKSKKTRAKSKRRIGVANGTRKIQGLGNFCPDLEISEAF